MKHLSGILNKLTLLGVVAVALSSCNRGEYAVLPATSSYHEAHRAVAVAPAVVTPAPVAPEAAPAAVPAQPAAVAAVVTPVAKPAKAAAAPLKLNLVQRAVVANVLKKVDKVANKVQLKKHSDVASAQKLSGNIRTGIILLLVGLLVSLLGGISAIFGILGGIIAIIGVILIILGLLDEV